jgi:integrase
MWKQDDDQLIFPNKISELWNQEIYLKDLDREVYQKTGISRPGRKTLGTHAWRHTAGAILISDNVPLKVVSDFLGHKSQAVTERVYVHILQEPKQEIASILSKYLRVS